MIGCELNNDSLLSVKRDPFLLFFELTESDIRHDHEQRVQEGESCDNLISIKDFDPQILLNTTDCKANIKIKT